MAVAHPVNSSDLRHERRSQRGPSNQMDGRSPFQRDRDRVLYSDYFRRLARVTQVASAVDAGVFHNRLLHSLKVAQVARRLAERLLDEHEDLAPTLDPDVVEAAALAHDLGHPPFGHAAESALREAAIAWGLDDGFEGNAQTFRIITRLATHSGREFGLDLTRATLDATLKYPWQRCRDESDPNFKKRERKYSVYDSDRYAFDFVRRSSDDEPSLEAQVMDYADSISYSVHDLEDFYRAGMIPVERLISRPNQLQQFMDRWRTEQPTNPAVLHFADEENLGRVISLLESLTGDVDERGSREDLELIETYRSIAITSFLGGVKRTGDNAVTLEADLDYQCRFLHRLVKDYVILRPSLSTQQCGQVEIVTYLANFFSDALKERRLDRIGIRFRKGASACTSDKQRKRFAIDIVASLAEDEAHHLYSRIRGTKNGSLLDYSQ